MYYDEASQRLWITAFTAENGPIEDDQDQITTDLYLDNAAPVALGNPTQASGKKGDYYYVLSKAQTVADQIVASCESSTPGVIVLPKKQVIETKVRLLGSTLEFNDGDVGQSETHRVVVTKV